MSDLNGIEIHDILGLSQPLTKLIETVSAGTGQIFEPIHNARMAKAKAREIKLICDAIGDNLALPASYQNGNVSISSNNTEELIRRAQNRFLFQQAKKQQNIESAVEIAYQELEWKDAVSDDPVDSDWVSEFFDSVANISDEKMQILWGKLLAGEVNKPGSFSLRSLSVLKHLTRKEVGYFETIAPYVLRCHGDNSKLFNDFFLIAHNEMNGKYGIHFPHIMTLCDAGLFSANTAICAGFEMKPGESEYIHGCNNSIVFENEGNQIAKFNINAYFLTEAGKELYPVALGNPCKVPEPTYLSDCLQTIQDLINNDLLYLCENLGDVKIYIPEE